MSIHAFAYAYVHADIKHSIEMPKKKLSLTFLFRLFLFFISLALSVAALSHSQFCLDFGCYFKNFADSDDVSFVCRCLLNMCHLSFTFVTMTSDDNFPFFSASLTSSRIAVTYSRHTRSLFHFFSVLLWFDLVSLISYPITNKLVHLFSVPCICSPTVHHSRYLSLFEHKINVVGQFQL